MKRFSGWLAVVFSSLALFPGIGSAQARYKITPGKALPSSKETVPEASPT